MKSVAPTQILFVGLSKREAGAVVGQLRKAGHLVSLVEDLEAARALLGSQGFDQAVLPGHIMRSLLENRARLEALDSEARRKSTLSIAYDIRGLLNALEQNIEELQPEGRLWAGKVSDFEEIRRRISVISAFLYELIFELTNSVSDYLNLTDVDLEEAVEAAAVVVYATASEKQQRLVVDIDEEVSRISADPIKLKLVLTNLLDYAVRQATPLGTVTVRATRDKDGCHIAVSHAGEAITSGELPRLFSPVLEPLQVASVGLSRVKWLIELHGGRVWVESQKGHGTIVFISLPLPERAHAKNFHRLFG